MGTINHICIVFGWHIQRTAEPHTKYHCSSHSVVYRESSDSVQDSVTVFSLVHESIPESEWFSYRPYMVKHSSDLKGTYYFFVLQRDSWRAMHALTQDSSQVYIMVIVSFPGPHQASLQCCNKAGRELGIRLIISMNWSASLEKYNY